MHGQFLRARPARTPDLFAARRIAGTGRSALWSGAREARRDAMPRRLQQWTDRRRISRGHLVFRGYARAAGANSRRAPQARETSCRGDFSSALEWHWGMWHAFTALPNDGGLNGTG